MSDNPYQSPSQSTRPQLDGRPVAATLFGVLNIVFGAAGAIFSLFGLITLSLMNAGVMPKPKLPTFMDNPALNNLNMINGIIGVFLPLLLVAAGIGLIRFRDWGRKLSNWWAVASLLILLVTVAIQFKLLLLPALNGMDAIDFQDPNEAGMFFGALGGLIGGCAGALYPLVLLVFMNRRSFKEQLMPAARTHG